jgi:VWFA-related protein
MRTSRWIHKISLLITLLITGFAAGAQNTPYTIRVDVPLATVDVTVVGEDGRPVTDLTREDFLILEDGVPQPIQSFAPADSPYSVLLLIDRSTSMQPHWPLILPSVARLLENLKPQDRIAIGAFDERSKDPQLLLDWRDVRSGTNEQIALNPVIGGFQSVRTRSSAGGAAYVSYPTKEFYRAISWAVEQLASVSGRKGVLVFSDGRQPRAPTRAFTMDGVRYVRLVDPADDDEFQKILRAAQKSEGRYYFAAVNTDFNPNGGRLGMGGIQDPLNFGLPTRARLEQLARTSGGRVAFPKRPEELLNLYGEIARELGTSYTLGYAPSPKADSQAYRRIDVRALRERVGVQQSRHYVPAT